jgi:hypothetical protein
MTAVILRFPNRVDHRWPDGALGNELSALAKMIEVHALRAGKPVTAQAARAATLDAFRSIKERA